MAAELFRRVATWVANELVTKRLATSPLFLKAAHKTHKTINQSAAEASSFAKRLESTLQTDPALAPKYQELKAAKEKLKQAMTSDSTSSPLGNQLRRRR